MHIGIDIELSLDIRDIPLPRFPFVLLYDTYIYIYRYKFAFITVNQPPELWQTALGEHLVYEAILGSSAFLGRVAGLAVVYNQDDVQNSSHDCYAGDLGTFLNLVDSSRSAWPVNVADTLGSACASMSRM